MTFLQPVFLWGLLTLAVPVLIHLWHQKRGQPLPWAAMQWLREASEQQKRGLQFDDWLLLALRCLLLALFSVLLAQPVWDKPNNPETIRPVHLVVADSLVTRSFRFELDRAGQRGEPIVRLPSTGPTNPLQLQTAIDSLNQPDVLLHLYIRRDASLADVPHLSVPERFSVHAASAQPTGNEETRPVLAKQFARVKSPLNVQLDYRDPLEQKTVRAALRALATVYGLRLNSLEGRTFTPRPDWILTDKPALATRPSPATLYIVSGAGMPPQTRPNVVFTADTLTPQTSERVATGQLPEWLGEQILGFYKLNPPPPALTEQELGRMFVPTNQTRPSQPLAQRTQAQNWLLVILLLVISVERWLALRK